MGRRLLKSCLAGLIGVQLVLPWLLAGVYSSTQAIVSWVVAALMLLTLVAGWLGRAEPVEAAVPTGVLSLLMAGILLGCWQLVPLPTWLAPVLAGGATEWRQLQLGEQTADGGTDAVGIAQSPVAVASTRSIYPADTRKGVALLALATGVFWLTLVGCSRTRVVWVLSAVACSGTVISLFGMVQKLRWNGKLFWVLDVGGSPYGPFANRNNAGGYLCMCLAAAVALFVYSGAAVGEEDRRHTSLTGAAKDDRRMASRGFWLTAMVLIAAGVVATGSRGASLSLVLASVITLVIWLKGARSGSSAGKSVAGWQSVAAVATVVVLTGSLLGWLGTGEQTRERWQQVFDEQEDRQENGRLANWTETIGSTGGFWGMGSGLQTYRFVGLPLQQRQSENWYRFAENQFIQAFVDAGLPGLLLLLAAITLVLSAALRLLSVSSRLGRSVGVMGVFLIASQAISGSFDFGLYVPANTLLMAMLCAVVVWSGSAFGVLSGVLGGSQRVGTGGVENVASGQLRDDASAVGKRVRPVFSASAGERGELYSPKNGPDPRLRRALYVAVVGCFLLVMTIAGGLELHRAGPAEPLIGPTLLTRLADSRSAEEIEEAIGQLSDAVRQRWDDGEAHLALARLYLQRYQIELFEVARRRQSWLDEELLWSQSNLLYQVPIFAGLSPEDRLRYREAAVKDASLSRAEFHMLAARNACPWLPQPHYWLAVLDALRHTERVGPAPEEAARRAERFGAGQAETWFWSGVLDRLADEPRNSMDAWEKCQSMTRNFDWAIGFWLEARGERREARGEKREARSEKREARS